MLRIGLTRTTTPIPNMARHLTQFTSFNDFFQTSRVTESRIGDLINSQPAPKPQFGGNSWQFQPGVYTPKQFIREISVLLESIIVQLGPDSPRDEDTRTLLISGLKSSLSHQGREATLQLEDWNSSRPSEITSHILNIGNVLYEYVVEAQHAVIGDPELTVFSPCEGHRWIPPIGRLLRGPRGSPNLMMLYNEWLHQITCLRDGLIAFENFEDVLLRLGDAARPGTRSMEDERIRLLTHVIRRTLPLHVLVDAAKALTAPHLVPGGYGFQYANGIALPAALFSGKRESNFLRFLPGSVADRAGLTFDMPNQDKTDGVDASTLGDAATEDNSVSEIATTLTVSLLNESQEASSAALTITGVVSRGRPFSVDVGSIYGGISMSQQISTSYAADLLDREHRVCSASDILSAPAEVRNPSLVPVVVKVSSTVERLAVLGKLQKGGVYWASRAAEVELEGHLSLETCSNQDPRFLIVQGDI